MERRKASRAWVGPRRSAKLGDLSGVRMACTRAASKQQGERILNLIFVLPYVLGVLALKGLDRRMLHRHEVVGPSISHLHEASDRVGDLGRTNGVVAAAVHVVRREKERDRPCRPFVVPHLRRMERPVKCVCACVFRKAAKKKLNQTTERENKKHAGE